MRIVFEGLPGAGKTSHVYKLSAAFDLPVIPEWGLFYGPRMAKTYPTDAVLFCWGKALLNDFRTTPPADIDALVNLVVRFSHVVAEFGETVRSIDLNPVVVLPRGQGVYIVDALVDVTG